MPDRLPELSQQDPYRTALTFQRLAADLHAALKQVAVREIRSRPCWCVSMPESAPSEREVETHEDRCDAVWRVYLRATHNGIGTSPSAGEPVVYQEPDTGAA